MASSVCHCGGETGGPRLRSRRLAARRLRSAVSCRRRRVRRNNSSNQTMIGALRSAALQSAVIKLIGAAIGRRTHAFLHARRPAGRRGRRYATAPDGARPPPCRHPCPPHRGCHPPCQPCRPSCSQASARVDEVALREAWRTCTRQRSFDADLRLLGRSSEMT